MSRDRSLPDDWRLVRFGEIVRQVKQTTKDPEVDGLIRVVGLEHMDSESLPLCRWNELSDLPDGTSFTRVFRSGQVLFGKRRAYQRKVAVADFDGVCSGDILVFEPANEELLPGFLPYVVQSDGFFDHALGTSAGSLSPRTKWQELAKYEFALPPAPIQERLIELLVATTDAALAATSAHWAAVGSLSALSQRFVTDPQSLMLKADVIEFSPLTDLADLKRGRFSHRPRNEPHLYCEGGPYPFVQTGNVQRAGRFITDFTQHLSKEGTTYSRSVPPGTLLTTIAAVIGATAYTTCTTFLPDSVVSVIPRDGVEYAYLEFVLRGLRSELETRVATENTQKNLSIELLGSVKVPFVSVPAQRWVVSLMESSWAVIDATNQTAACVKSVETQLREQLLTGADHV